MKSKAYPRRLGKWLVVGAGLGFTVASLAAETGNSCSFQPAYPLPQAQSQLQTQLEQLDTLAATPACLQNPAFFAWRGALLLAGKQPAAAIEALERALLLDPQLPGAQLDYVDALLGVGDTAAARALIQQLLLRPDLPEHLRPLLTRELAASQPDAWRNRWVLSTAVGADSNLNSAPSADSLTLTFPHGPITLALLDSARPASGASGLATLQWQGLKPVGTQLWLLQADLRARHTAQAATRYQQADLSATWLQAPQAAQQWLVRSGLTGMNFGGQTLQQSFRTHVLHQWQTTGTPALASESGLCQPSTGLELEWRRYPTTPDLNGRYTGLMGALHCSLPGHGKLTPALTPALFSHQLLSLQLRLGGDRADTSTRPGGDYRRAEIRTTWEARYGSSKVSADYGYSRQIDSSGYSPLLGDNLPRKTSRHSLRLEIARPLPWLAGAEGFISLEANQQNSNLAAFDNRQKAAYAGLRWSQP